MLKHELRKEYRKKRNLLNSESVLNQSIEISNKVLTLPIWNFSFYHIFLSISENNEVDTEPILSILYGKDKHIVIPKILTNGKLINFLLTDTTELKVNSLGIPEPVDGIEIPEEKIEVVFVPLLAFDTLGNRIGYGKGFYDIFLKKCAPNTIKIGLSFFEPITRIEDVSEHDIPLDYCVTPSNIYEF